MTLQEAHEILHPDTSIKAMCKIGYYAGFREKEAQLEAVEEACLIACEALEKHFPKKVNNYEKACDIYGDCPSCGESYSFASGDEFNYCPECGQRLDWGEENE